jgi:membrane protein required for colicin V production
MHYLDIIILVIIIASAIEGGFHGFIYEVCSLVGIIAGFVLAIQFFAEIAGFLDFIPIPLWLLKALSFLIILIATNILFRLMGKALREILRKIFMGWLDRIAGVIFGLVRGFLTVLVIILVLLISPISKIIQKEARETNLLQPSIELVKPFLGNLKGQSPPSIDSI